MRPASSPEPLMFHIMIALLPVARLSPPAHLLLPLDDGRRHRTALVLLGVRFECFATRGLESSNWRGAEAPIRMTLYGDGRSHSATMSLRRCVATPEPQSRRDGVQEDLWSTVCGPSSTQSPLTLTPTRSPQPNLLVLSLLSQPVRNTNHIAGHYAASPPHRGTIRSLLSVEAWSTKYMIPNRARQRRRFRMTPDSGVLVMADHSTLARRSEISLSTQVLPFPVSSSRFRHN
jgi:hypothetical protein